MLFFTDVAFIYYLCLYNRLRIYYYFILQEDWLVMVQCW